MSSIAPPFTLQLPSGGVLCVAPLRKREELLGEVSQAEIAQTQHFKSEARVTEFLSWRALARKMLGVGSESELIEYNDVGAPQIIGHKLSIGVSHSRKAVAVLISPTPCAIDIEESDRNFANVAPRYTSESERELGCSLAELWCAKETLYKYSGLKGLNLIDDIKVNEYKDGVIKASIAPHHTTIMLRSLKVDNHIITYIG